MHMVRRIGDFGLLLTVIPCLHLFSYEVAPNLGAITIE